MKRYLVLLIALFFVLGSVYSQESVILFDEAVSTLANSIHVKLLEKKAEKITIGQFIFQDGVPAFSSYWVNQLQGELINKNGRTYTIYSGSAMEANWVISGEIVQIADIIRIYTTIICLHERTRTIEASFISNFTLDENISEMFFSSNGSSGQSTVRRDSYEPDSWEAPVTFVIGNNPNTPVMNRTITPGDEDFFLLIPDRDGRLTAETTGNIDTFMHLYNYDNGDELTSDDDSGQATNARIIYNVQSGIRYLAVVRGYDSSVAGAYGFRAFLSVREGAGSWNNPIPYEIGNDENNVTTVNRVFQAGDEDYFLLVPARSGRITIETTGRIDTYMELYDADRELLDEDDDGGQNLNARIRYIVEEGKRYFVLVRGYNTSVTGSYGFRVFFAGSGLMPPDKYEPNDEPSEATPIEIGEEQEHTFHTADDVDWFVFQITNVGFYTIHTRGVKTNRLDTYIELYDNNLHLIDEDDDGGNALSSLLRLNLPKGTYFLKVRCLDEEPDQAYIITITAE